MPACRVQSGCWEAAVASSSHGIAHRCALNNGNGISCADESFPAGAYRRKIS